MKFLLFINYFTGLKHNSVYEDLNSITESLTQLAEEEELNPQNESIPTVDFLQKYLKENDDYVGRLSNGTWFHIQCNPVFSTP